MIQFPYLRGFRVEKQFEEDYLNHIPEIRHLHQFAFRAPVTIFVGENGSGKSTLLEALAVLCGLNPEGGTRNFTFSTNETHSPLYKSLQIIRSVPFPSEGFFLRAESYYNVASEVERLGDSGFWTTGNPLCGTTVANPSTSSPTGRAL